MLAALLPGTMLACSTIFGFQDLTLLDAGSGDASADAPGESTVPDVMAESQADAVPEAAPNEGGCVHAVPPGLPATDDTPDAGDGGVDTVFALATLDIGQNGSGQFDPNDALGFDLDGFCTCIDDGGPSCTGSAANCDTTGGRDEGANVMLAALGHGDSHLDQASLQQRIASGGSGLIVHVSGYNGLANDRSVIVEYFPSPGSVTPPSTDGGTPWNVTMASVAGGGFGSWVSRYQDIQGYVNDYVLVSHLASFPLVILPNTGANDNPITFQLEDVVVQATLMQTGGIWSMTNGQVGARWSTSDALYSLHTLTDDNGNWLCGNAILYQLAAGEICTGADIASVPSGDGRGQPCNALSVAIGFTANQAQLADAFDPPVVPSDCPEDWAPSCP